MERERHRNGGLRKRCGCSRRHWPKCRHAWHWNYKPRGRPHVRLSLDRELGRHIDSKTEAEREAARIRVAIDAGTYRRGASSGTTCSTVGTFAAYARDWLKTAAPNLKASTVRFYADKLKTHIVPVLGDVPIDAITRKDCRELVTTVREKDLSLNTVRGIARTLSAVLSQAVEDGHLSANPALRLGKYLRRGDEPKPQIDPLTRTEAAHVLTVARERFPDWYPWLLCALRTGLRLGELLALQWGDIDWHGGYLRVQRNLVAGKLTTPKNHQCRRVDLSRQLRATLRLARRRSSAAWLALGYPRPLWVFASVVGTPLDESNVRKMYARILNAAGIRHHRIHDLRHTFASLLIQQGESLVYVRDQMGHASIQITADIYGHLVPGGNRAAVDRLDDADSRTRLSASRGEDSRSPDRIAQPLHTPILRRLRRTA